MDGRTRTNLLLLVLVAGLGLAVWLTPSDTPPAPVPLTGLDPAEVRHMSLGNRNGADLVLERRGDGWWMIRPYAITANDERARLLLGILAAPSHESFPVPADGLADYGLQPPAAVLEVDGTRIEMGGTHPYNHDRYLRLGDRIHLVKDLFPHHLMASAEAYVSPRLLPRNTRIEAIETPDWTLRRSDGGWVLEPDPGDRSQDPLVAKAQAWEQARALQVLPAPEVATNTPAVTVRLRGEAAPLGFVLWRRDGDLLLVRPEMGLAWRLPPDTPLLTPPGGE